MNKRDLARESKQINNNPHMRIQVAEKVGGGFNAYRVYDGDWFEDNEDETTIGFIDYPMTIAQVSEWLGSLKAIDGKYIPVFRKP